MDIDHDIPAFLACARYRAYRLGTRNPIPLPKNSESAPLVRGKLNLIIRRAAEKTGIQKCVKRVRDNKSHHEVHLHAFRRYWKYQMRKAGINDDEFLNYIMGHVPPYEGAYDKYTEELVVKLYRQATPHLSLTRAEEEVTKVKEEAALEALRQLARTFGIDPSKIRVEREDMSVEEEISAIQAEIKRFIAEALRLRKNSSNNNRYESRIVSEENLESVNAGWEFQAQIGERKYVVRRLRET
jgi:hypothetical protein